MITFWDWLIIALYLVISLAIALFVARSSAKSNADYFLGGRTLPGWLAGLSIVATTFAADTPLWVTEQVRLMGISGNWQWWNMLIGGMFTTFFFARMWHRAGITTDVELVRLRYSGAGALLLRPLKSVYFGVLLNGVVMAWVNLALMKILQVFLGLSELDSMLITGGLLLLTCAYTLIGGLKGVVITDAFQFTLAMVGCIVLAVLVVGSPDIGGISGLKDKLMAGGHSSALDFFPTIGSDSTTEVFGLGLASLVSFFGLQWWAGWYPGNEPGGGGYVAQRLMATRSERAAQQASLIFQILHYCVRPWPWILVALASLVLYPHLAADQHSQGYILAMKDYLPAGLRGLLLASFLAAYMSTQSTQLNWGASYLTNDFLLPLRPGLSQGGQVWAGRLATLMLALLGLLFTRYIQTLDQAFHILINASAGLGGVLIARWYWWRVNAWAEVAALISPIAMMFILEGIRHYHPGFLPAPYDFMLMAGITTVVWVLTAYLTPRTQEAQLAEFRTRVDPRGAWPGVGWGGLRGPVLLWGLAVVAAYAWLLGIGYTVLQMPEALWVLPLAVGTTALWAWLGRRWQ